MYSAEEALNLWIQSMTAQKRVLVVDDDELVRTVFARAARDFCAEVTLAETAAIAIQLLGQGTYDMLFLDMRLEARLSGMEVLRRVNLDHDKMTVVIMSGSVNLHDTMLEANKLGVLAFIRKPVSFTVDYVKTILQRLGVKPLPPPVAEIAEPQILTGA